MKTENIAHTLTRLTANLSSPLPENEKYLDTVRRIIGYNLRYDRQEISAAKLQPEELAFTPLDEKVQEFRQYAVSKLHEDDKFLVQRIQGRDRVPVVTMQLGDVRLPVNPIEAVDELRWNQIRGEELGPFLSDAGQSIWFDLYYYEDKLTVRSQSDSISYFLFSKARLNKWITALENAQTIGLNAGYVWISAKLFADGTGDNDYVGFNITGGSFSIVNPISRTGQFLDFTGGFTGKLTLQLVQPEKGIAAIEGCSAAQEIRFQYPGEVTFTWENGRLTNIAAGEGQFAGYGNELKLTDYSSAVVLQNELNHILIPCQVEPSVWQVNFTESRIFKAEGDAEIQSAFWALPIVRVSNAATLTEPQNSGGWELQLSSQLAASFIGSDQQQPNALLNDPLLLLYPQALFLYSPRSEVDVTTAQAIEQEFFCWQISSENPARIPLSLTYRDSFLLAYYCHAIEGETLLAGCTGQMQPDRPIFTDGSAIAMKALKGWVFFQARAKEIKINAVLDDPASLGAVLAVPKFVLKSFALENALVAVSRPARLVLEGTLSAANSNSIEKGQMTLSHGVFRWKPILPDPYVSNLQSGWNLERTSTPASSLFAQTTWEQIDQPIVTFRGDLVLAAGVSIKPTSPPTIQSLPVQLDDLSLRQIKANAINTKRRERKNQIDGFFDQIEKQLVGWKLLDVSTNMDLIGVSISPLLASNNNTLATTAIAYQPSPISAFVIKEMAVNTPLSVVHLFTVPQVQWEPVKTLPEDQNIATLGWFPENLSSATDGSATRLISLDQTLSPIIPDVVVRQIQKSFAEGKPTAAMTTLSFGLRAIVQLTSQNTASRHADSLDIVQPEFPQNRMKGGIQINLMAESGNPLTTERSPGFEGFMVQTLNGYELFTGTELGLSVLGATLQPDSSVETLFNNEFAPGARNPFVPVTRFDLSGYGASNFSEWDNPKALAQIGKVQFKIMVGRTAFEVVKFVSKIYPWGMTVTRSVTIERRSSGGVVRKDSGWQATQAGIFDFSTSESPQPYVFCPGLFRGCFNAKNIRPASNSIIRFNDAGKAIELAPVYFDADVQLDGQSDGTVFSKGILGFIQLEPKGETLPVSAFQKLIQDQGAIGGPTDTVLNVGNSDFGFRATRFEVDVTSSGGTPVFVGVVRGQPLLPNNGSWSVVKMAAPGNLAAPQEAVSADVDRGTPLLLENSWGTPEGNAMKVSSPAGPYRFVDPADLFLLLPRFDYGFMQNTGSQAFLFRRPTIALGSHKISSQLSPAFADPFALYSSKGVFPPIANAIEFPPSSYELLIQSGTGKLQLNTPIALGRPREPLLIAKDGTNEVVVDYDRSQFRYILDYESWEVELGPFSTWVSLAGVSRLFGNEYSLRAGTSRQAQLANAKSLLKSEIRDALSFIPGMNQDQNIKDIDLGMTNAEHEVQLFAGYKCEIEVDITTGTTKAKCVPKTPTERPEFENKKSISFAIKSGLGTGIIVKDRKPQFLLKASLGGELQAKIPVSGIVFIVLGLEIGADWKIFPKSEVSLEIVAYFGVGLGSTVGPFAIQGFFAAGIAYKFENDTSKWGGLVKVEAEADLKVVVIGISAELKGVYYKGDDPDTPATETDKSLIDASGEVAINVSIFLVINIKASYEYQTLMRP